MAQIPAVHINHVASLHPKSAVCAVFLHGMGGELTAWNGVREALFDSGISTIGIDLRGHGDSDRPKDPSAYTVNALASDVIAVLEKYKNQEIYLVGHCLGGIVAQVVAGQYASLSGLVLVNTVSQTPEYARLLKYTVPIFNTLARILPSTYVRKRPDYRRFANSHDLSPRRIFSDIIHTSLKSYSALLGQTMNLDLRHTNQKLRIPTLIISGRNDVLFSSQLAQSLQSHIKGAKLTFIENGNHTLLFNEQTHRELTQKIRSFIIK